MLSLGQFESDFGTNEKPISLSNGVHSVKSLLAALHYS